MLSAVAQYQCWGWFTIVSVTTAGGSERVVQRDGLRLQGDYYISGFFPLHETDGPSSGMPALDDCKT